MILLTGATGVVGTAVRERNPRRDLTSLTHSQPLPPGEPQFPGDITRPRLGLSESDYRELADAVDVVIHCAANVSMSPGATDYGEVNITGTREVIGFARDASARLVQVSTAFVDVGAGEDAAASYTASKHAAEAAVREAGLDYAIVRPSIVVGDLVTGEISSEQGFHRVSRSLLQGPVRVMPGDASTFLDCVPVDYLADAIIAVANEPPTDSRELWLTSGPDAVRLGEAIEILNDQLDAYGVDGSIRTVAYETVDRVFVPVFLPELPDKERKRIEAMLFLARHLARDEAFPSSSGLIAATYGLEMPDPSAVFRRNAEGVAERLFGQPAERPAAVVEAAPAPLANAALAAPAEA